MYIITLLHLIGANKDVKAGYKEAGHSSSWWLVCQCLVMFIFATGAVHAQSQNEIEVSVLFDGTAGFSDPNPAFDTGTNPDATPHSPGFDENANNNVVRTNDQFAIKVTWNVNEDAATGVTLTTVLPDIAEWTVGDIDGVFGYAGCEVTEFGGGPATAAGATGTQSVTCELGPQDEGSNGAIRLTALLNEELDNTTFDVTSSLTTDADPAGVADGLETPLTVSEGPFVDYIKNSPIRSELINNGTENGYVVFFPLSFNDHSQGTAIKGVGPVNDTVDVQLYDHAWNLTDSARLATAAEMALANFEGDNCGDYEQGAGDPNVGPYVVGNGTWVCGTETTGAGGYSVTSILVSGFQSRDPATDSLATAFTTFADGSANSVSVPQISAGQIAFWLSDAEVQEQIMSLDNPDPILMSDTSAQFDNSLVEQDQDVIITEPTTIVDATGNGTSGGTNNGNPANNTASVVFGIIPDDPTTGGGGPSYGSGHDIRWSPGPLKLAESQQFVDADGGNVYTSFDYTQTAPYLDGAFFRHFLINPFTLRRNSIGEVARGQTITLESLAFVTGVDEPEDQFLGIQQCVALDTAHYNLVSVPSDIDVRINTGTDDTTLGFETVPASDGIFHVVQGQMLNAQRRERGNINRFWGSGLGGASEGWDYVIEVTNAPKPTDSVSGNTGINEMA